MGFKRESKDQQGIGAEIGFVLFPLLLLSSFSLHGEFEIIKEDGFRDLHSPIVGAIFGSLSQTLRSFPNHKNAETFILVKSENTFIEREITNTLNHMFNRFKGEEIFSDSDFSDVFILRRDPSIDLLLDEEITIVKWYDGNSNINTLKQFVGSVHRHASRCNVLILGGSKVTHDEMEEMELWKNTAFVSLRNLKLFNLEDLISEMKILHFRSLQTGLFEEEKEGENLKCWLEMPYEAPKSFKVEPNLENPSLCLAIPTYSKKYGGGFLQKPEELSLYNIVLKSLISTHRYSKLNISVFLATQEDEFFDNPSKVNEFKSLWDKTLERSKMNVPIHFHRFPLSHGLVDITWKWNMIVKKAYEAGCEYIYQYSDDTFFEDHLELDQLVKKFKLQSNFGSGGMVDLNHPGLLTLSMTHRTHIDIMGSYWPTTLRNWWSDDWSQQIYGKYIVKDESLRMSNLQPQGRRYDVCEHTKRELPIALEEGTKKINKWLEENRVEGINSDYFRERDEKYWKSVF